MTPMSKNAEHQFPKRFYCDHCGEIIDKLPQGWLLWDSTKNHKYYNFLIVHFGCMKENQHLKRMSGSMTLDRCFGFEGMALFLSFLDLGAWVKGEDSEPEVEDIGECVEIFRRLYIPNYEEARRFFADAGADGFFQEANGAWEHKLETLEKVIDKYGKK